MKDSRFTLFVAALCIVGYGWIVVNSVWGGGVSFHTVCFFKMVTGIPCPSCGTTRSIVHLMHGDIAGALQTNPFGLLAGICLVAVPAWLLSDSIRNTSTFVLAWHKAESVLSQKPWIAVTLIMAVIANWGWNIVKGL